MNMGEIISKLICLLILIIVGYSTAKTGILNQITIERLTKVVIYIALPGLIFHSMTSVGNASLGEAGVMLLASTIFYVLLVGLALLITKLLRPRRQDMGVYQFILAFSNVAFMGYPVVSAVFDEGGTFYCALFNVPFNLVMYSVGTIMLIKASGNGAFTIKKLLNPPFVTCLVGLAAFAMKLNIPAPIADCAEMLGDATTPMAMLILGSSLAQVPIREIFSQWRVYVVALYKLIALPVATWFVAGLFLPADSMILKTLTLMAAMPVATNATMMTIEFGGNQGLAAKSIFITTILCVVTIPILVLLFFT